MQKDIRLPKSLIVTAKSNENVPGLIVDETGSVSLIQWINNMISEGEVNVSGATNADDITVTPSGNLEAVNVQSALEELQVEIDGISVEPVDTYNFNSTNYSVTDLNVGLYTFDQSTDTIINVNNDPSVQFTVDFFYVNGSAGKEVEIVDGSNSVLQTISTTMSSATNAVTNFILDSYDGVQPLIYKFRDTNTSEIYDTIKVGIGYTPYIGISTGSIISNGTGGAGTFDVSNIEIRWRDIPISALPFNITVNNNIGASAQTVQVGSINGSQVLNTYESITDGQLLTLSFVSVTETMGNGADLNISLPTRSFSDQ